MATTYAVQGKSLPESCGRNYNKTIKPLVREVEQEDGVLIIDDTIEEKPYTDENDIVCYHFDHTKGKSVKGINLVNFVYHVGLAEDEAYSAKEKVAALRKHFLESVPVSDVCDEYGIQPRLFYDWQRMFFTNGERVFEQKREQGATRHQQEIARLEEKLRKKDEVL